MAWFVLLGMANTILSVNIKVICAKYYGSIGEKQQQPWSALERNFTGNPVKRDAGFTDDPCQASNTVMATT